MLGIVCAAKTSMGGKQLLFRYPPIIRDVPYRGSNSEEAIQLSKSNHRSGKSSSHGPGYLEPYSLSSRLLASILIPKRQLCNEGFEIEVDDTLFVGYPTLVQGVSSDEENEVEEEEDEEESGEDALIAFNVTFVCVDRKEEMVDEFKELARRLSAALLHTNNRGYLSREVRTILNIREVWVEEQIRIAQLVRAAGQEESEVTIAMARNAHAKLSEDILQVSQFAKELRAIFHSIKVNQSVNLALNGWVAYSYVMKERRRAEATAKVHFRPFHALLIVWPDEFLNDARRPAPDPRQLLPVDANLSLRMLMGAARPVKSFQDLHLELGLSYSHLYRLAAHLLYWGKAKMVYKLSQHSIYSVNPQAKVNQSLYRKFGATFGTLSLTTVLASFSQPVSLQEVCSTVPDVIAVVSWLLLHDTVKQVHEYAILLPPPSDGDVCCSEGDLSWLEKLQDSSQEYEDLVRLVPMLDGKQDFFELMYRFSMSRARLLAVFDKYHDIIVTLRHHM